MSNWKISEDSPNLGMEMLEFCSNFLLESKNADSYIGKEISDINLEMLLKVRDTGNML